MQHLAQETGTAPASASAPASSGVSLQDRQRFQELDDRVKALVDLVKAWKPEVDKHLEAAQQDRAALRKMLETLGHALSSDLTYLKRLVTPSVRAAFEPKRAGLRASGARPGLLTQHGRWVDSGYWSLDDIQRRVATHHLQLHAGAVDAEGLLWIPGPEGWLLRLAHSERKAAPGWYDRLKAWWDQHPEDKPVDTDPETGLREQLEPPPEGRMPVPPEAEHEDERGQRWLQYNVGDPVEITARPGATTQVVSAVHVSGPPDHKLSGPFAPYRELGPGDVTARAGAQGQVYAVFAETVVVALSSQAVHIEPDALKKKEMRVQDRLLSLRGVHAFGFLKVNVTPLKLEHERVWASKDVDESTELKSDDAA